MKDIFKTILQEFQERSLPELIPRPYHLPENDQIQTLIGLRRVGKTYLLYQKIQELILKDVPKETILFINFEDERLLNLKAEHLHLLLEAYYELHPENTSKKLYLFFDEIHAAPSWNLFLKRLYEQKKLYIYVTGSSSNFSAPSLLPNYEDEHKHTTSIHSPFLSSSNSNDLNLEKTLRTLSDVLL